MKRPKMKRPKPDPLTPQYDQTVAIMLVAEAISELARAIRATTASIGPTHVSCHIRDRDGTTLCGTKGPILHGGPIAPDTCRTCIVLEACRAAWFEDTILTVDPKIVTRSYVHMREMQARGFWPKASE